MLEYARPSKVVIANVGFAADAKHAEEEGRKNHLKPEKEPHRPEEDLPNFSERAESAGSPAPCDPGAAHKSGKEEGSAEEQPRFQGDALEKAAKRDGAAIEPRRITEKLCESANGNDLRAEKSEDDAKDHCVDVEDDARSHMAGTWKEPEHQEKAKQEKEAARQQEELIRGIHQHEAQAAPAVAETAQMGRTPALVGPQDDGYLRDSRANLRGLDHELEREFHARAAHIQAVVYRSREASHPAITVSDARAEQRIQERRQSGVAEISVQERHRAGLDTPKEAITHHQVIALAKLLDEIRHFAEVVAVIGIAHDDVGSAASCNSRLQRGAIAARLDSNHPGSVSFRDFNRAVGRAVVSDDDLAAQPGFLERRAGLINAKSQRICLV